MHGVLNSSLYSFSFNLSLDGFLFKFKSFQSKSKKLLPVRNRIWVDSNKILNHQISLTFEWTFKCQKHCEIFCFSVKINFLRANDQHVLISINIKNSTGHYSEFIIKHCSFDLNTPILPFLDSSDRDDPKQKRLKKNGKMRKNSKLLGNYLNHSHPSVSCCDT